MSQRTKLFRLPDPYDLPASDALFLQAVRENCAFHYAHCPEYRSVLDSFSFRPEDLREYDDLVKLPFLPTLTFKKHRLFSLPPPEHGGGVHLLGHLRAVQPGGLRLPRPVVLLEHAVEDRPSPGLFLLYSHPPISSGLSAPAGQPHLGGPHRPSGPPCSPPPLSRTYALRYQNGGYAPDLDGVAAALVKHGASRFPVRLVGFPSYTYFLLRQMEERGIQVHLRPPAPRSCWGAAGSSSTPSRWTSRCSTIWSNGCWAWTTPTSSRCSAPWSIPSSTPTAPATISTSRCTAGSSSRDVDTLEPLPDGQVGLVELITPLMTATPILAVMTDDLGMVHPGGSCGCGNPAPWLEIIGRVGLKDIKTCAAGAAELLSGGEGT